MRASDVETLRSSLQRRRRIALGAAQRTTAAIGELRGAEHDSELEEGSQSEQQQYNLSRLGEVAQKEVALIDAALQRLDAGEYGLCRECGEAIGANRLAAVPFTVECADCAAGREEASAALRERAERTRIAPPE